MSRSVGRATRPDAVHPKARPNPSARAAESTAGDTGAAARIMALQRTAGNRAVQRMVRGSERTGLGARTRPPAGRTLARAFVARGSTADFATMVNRILGTKNEIRINSSGVVSVHATNVKGPQTRDATELLNAIQTVIGDSRTTTIEFIHGATSTRASDTNVIVGNYALERVDLDDVGTFGFESSHSEMGDNAAVQLIHEITEQYRKQVHGESFPVAHQAGYRAQERLLGATLVRESPMTPIPGGTLGEVTTTYRYPNGREVDVITRMDFATGNIVSVRRTVRAPAPTP
jgi:hypothetical protein